MVKVNKLLLLLMVLAYCSAGHASKLPDRNSATYFRSMEVQQHNAGDLLLSITNYGILGDPLAGGPSALWPGEGGTEHLYQADFWLGARVAGVPYVTTSVPDLEWRPGSDPVFSIYGMANGDTGGNRYPNPFYDDDGDLLEDEDPKDGFDNDSDGAIDEDFAAISDQMFRCTFRDYLPECFEYSPSHHPLVADVVRQTYQWGSPEYRDFVGIDYEIYNVGESTFEDVYLGFYADFDVHTRGLRDASDDLVGLYTGEATASNGSSVWVETAFMYDDPEESSSYIGVVFLDHTTDPTGGIAPVSAGISSIQIFRGDVPFDEGGDPSNDNYRWIALSTSESDSPPITPRDYRVLITVGPFPYFPSHSWSLRCSYALVAGADWEAYLENAADAVECYMGKAYDRDGDPGTGEDGKEFVVHWHPEEAEVTGLPDVQPLQNQMLACSFPNPFNPSTAIRFTLPEASLVTLSVYDLAGRRVCDLHRGELAQGDHEVQWHGVDAKGTPVPSGVYLYRLEAGGQVLTQKMTLLK